MHRSISRGLARVGATSLLLLAACPGNPTPVFPFGESASPSTGELPGITTFGGTIDPTNPIDDTGPDTADGTTAGREDTTTSGSATDSDATDSGTTSGGSTDSGTTGGSSDGGMTSMGSSGGGSSSGGMTSMGSSGGGSSSGGSTGGPPMCHDVAGNYDNCLDMAGAVNTTPCNAPGDATCLITGGPPPTAGVCAIEDCVDACDCPASPATGNAVVTCDDVTGDPTMLFCYLDCGMGETCPTGMDCFGGFLCIWPGPGAMGTPYGDCFNNPTSICGIGGICLNDGAMPTIGVCTEACPGGVGDCPAAPPGGAAPVACNDLTGDGAAECFLNCAGGAACPPGMTCFANICVWN